MEEFKDAPAELLNHLKLSEQCPEPGPRAAQPPQSSGTAPSPGQPPEECFHDCHDSLEAQGAVLDDEGNVQDAGSSSRKQTEPDEEYLLELEKDLPEEEKQVMGALLLCLKGSVCTQCLQWAGADTKGSVNPSCV